ncbi:MAG TPA: SCO family protein [Polyangiaceae bacterium]|jgi:protein SCO1/2|nr:SCO family protein [Polyangiaceae bacterium]
MPPTRYRKSVGSGTGATWRLLACALLAVAGAACEPASAKTETSGAPIVMVSSEVASVDAPLPDFDLVDQKGRKVKRADLAGKVWVTDFIFTTCGSICPKLTQTMSAVAADVTDPGVRFVSITVDPENDTPEKLDAYATKYGADPSRWIFLTGEPREVEQTILKGFRVALGKSAGGEIFHAERFVVVDKKGTVRGIYDANDAGIAELKLRVRSLLAE